MSVSEGNVWYDDHQNKTVCPPPSLGDKEVAGQFVNRGAYNAPAGNRDKHSGWAPRDTRTVDNVWVAYYAAAPLRQQLAVAPLKVCVNLTELRVAECIYSRWDVYAPIVAIIWQMNLKDILLMLQPVFGTLPHNQNVRRAYTVEKRLFETSHYGGPSPTCHDYFPGDRLKGWPCEPLTGLAAIPLHFQLLDHTLDAYRFERRLHWDWEEYPPTALQRRLLSHAPGPSVVGIAMSWKLATITVCLTARYTRLEDVD
ncbi:hypothetical protein DAEQUDRAFT_738279 [Daedalea quercina L-15889]|uniref:Uncharacterized protein n=1 Tax=Daedalea quercina L-15889 TaxID=1314783 RepID=A0A165Q952_9APHY|nr:hypothetical protein DAEQUDRAFT_738279 [Daedalea quercina L-15889]